MKNSFASLSLLALSAALSACALDGDVAASREALVGPPIATATPTGIVVHEDVLRHDIEGEPILAMEIVYVGDTPYLRREHARGDRVHNNYVELVARGDDFFVGDGVESAEDCGSCHRDDRNCVACRMAIVAPHGTTACVCSDGNPGRCTSGGAFQIEAEDIYAM